MVYRLLAIAIALATSTLAYAQTDAGTAPKTMFGFLKPGTNLAISSVDGTTNVIIHTYTADDYKVVRDIQKKLAGSPKTASTIAETNEYVRAKLDEYSAKHNLSDDSKKRIIIGAPVRTSFGTIVAVGDDYLLINIDRDDQGRRIIPKTSIGSVYLDANPAPFYDPSKRE